MIPTAITAGLAPRRQFSTSSASIAHVVRSALVLQAQELAGRAHEGHHKATGERPYHRVREALQDHGGQSFRSVAGFGGEAVEIRLAKSEGRTVARQSSAHCAPHLLTEQMQQ